LCLVATSPADQQRTAVNSPASVQENYEAMTPTQASVNQQQIATANLNSKINEFSFSFFINSILFSFIKVFKQHLLLMLKHHFGVQYFIMN